MEGHGKKNRKNKSKLVVFTIIGVAVIVYLAFAIYFKDRFIETLLIVLVSLEKL